MTTDDSGWFRFSTDDFPAKDRYAIWHDYVTKHILQMRSSDFPKDASVTLTGRSLGKVTFAKRIFKGFRGDRYSVSYDPKFIRRFDTESFMLGAPIMGAGYAIQDDREINLNAGDIAFVDGRRPWESGILRDSQSLYVVIPLSAIRARLYNFDQGAGLRLDAASPIGEIARNFILSLLSTNGDLAPEAQERLGEHIIDLIAMAVAEVTNNLATPSAHRTALLYRIKRFIEANLARADLDTRIIADAFRISPRYVARLFAEEGTSVQEFIVSHRLQRSRQMLADKGSRGRLIEDIARSNGFQSASHFSRKFAAKYQESPRAFRNVAFARSDY
jgi:AraC-like DNA-binding protein